MARQITKIVSAYFTSQDVRHEVAGREDEAILTGFSGLENAGTIEIAIVFDDNERTCQLFTRDYISVPKDKIEKMYPVLNSLNAEYRWATFYINDEGTIILKGDGVLDYDTCGTECEELTHRIVGIGNEAYPIIMKAVWS